MALERNFHHPYKPYDIQIEFMKALYDCIDQRKVGIFESPTGTGKSLSLICGSLSWLRDDQLRTLEIEETGDSDDEPEWVLAQIKATRKAAFEERKKEIEARLQKIREKEALQRTRYESGEAMPKRPRTKGAPPRLSEEANEEEFLLDDYQSDTEPEMCNDRSRSEIGVSNKSLELAIRIGLAPEEKKSEDEAVEDQVKVFFSSRTHSQLVQFANETKRVKIPMEGSKNLSPGKQIIEGIRHLSLGSRKTLCINKDVRKLGGSTAINEKCLDMQQSKSSIKKCSFLPTKENETLVHQFRDHTLAKIRDIEDLVVLGERIGVCPYYASRATIKPSEIVTLPYPLLLQKSARAALDISLKNHVVIIDEAHNLMDAIAGIYSVQISLSQLKKARSQLIAYLQKFRNRLKGKNRVYVAQTVRLLDSMVGCLQELATKSSAHAEGGVNVSTLLAGKGADQINLYKLTQYLQESKLARKVDGYTIFTEERVKLEEPSTPVLTLCQGIFQSLTYPSQEGRFFWSNENEDVVLKYLLLDTTNHFKEIVDEARAVILAGGTMSPMDDYKQHLFPYLDSDRIMTLSCGHVIPAENLIALPIATTRSGVELDFTFEKRNSQQLMDGLGETIIDLVSGIPDGVVIFFPSYVYLEQLIARWKTANSSKENIFARLQNVKPVMYEGKTDTAVAIGSEDILERYSNAINSPTSNKRGAVLLSVVGGKLSEGINFSDKLGRGVLIVGLPFPNIKSTEWKAKLEYVEQQTLGRGGSSSEAKTASRTFYENACMRAVNQCIGRAIRHKEDYAGIFLLDRRYATTRIQAKLPGWIQNGLVDDAGKLAMDQISSKVQRFFAEKTTSK